MSNLRHQPTQTELCNSRIAENSSLRSQRRRQLMEEKRKIITTEKVSELPLLRIVEEVCEKVKNGEHFLIDTLDSYLIGDHAVHRIIMNSRVCPYLIANIPQFDNETVLSILKLFISFVSEKNAETYTLHLFQSGLMNIFDNMFGRNFNIINHFLWLLANVASDGQQFVKIMIEKHLIEKIDCIMSMIGMKFEIIRNIFNLPPVPMDQNDKLCQIVVNMSKDDVLILISLICWLYSNICRTRFDIIANNLASIVTFVGVIISKNFEQIASPNCICDALWTFVFISEQNGFDNTLQNELFIERVLELIMHQQKIINTPALRILGNLSAKDDRFLSVMIKKGILQRFEYMLQDTANHNVSYQEMFWTLSNICAAEDGDIPKLIVMQTGLVGIMSNLFIMGNFDNKIKIEIAYSLLNLFYFNKKEILQFIIQHYPEVLPLIVQILRDFKDEYKITSLGLKAIMNFVEFGDNCGMGMRDLFESLRIVDVLNQIIEKFKNDKNPSSLLCRRLSCVCDYFIENQKDQDEEDNIDME